MAKFRTQQTDEKATNKARPGARRRAARNRFDKRDRHLEARTDRRGALS